MWHIESQLVHALNDGDPRFGDVVCPIHLSTTFAQERFGRPIRYDYARGGNPTRQVVEDQIAILEDALLSDGNASCADGNAADITSDDNCDGAKGGLAFATGMAAITAVLSLFKPGDEIIVPKNLYGGTFRILDKYFSRFGLRYRFADFSNPVAVEQALTIDESPESVKKTKESLAGAILTEATSAETQAAATAVTETQAVATAVTETQAVLARRPQKAVFFESPTNPLLEVIDIAAIAAIAKRHNALTIVDNTFMTPYLQQPLKLGADIVLHSATKYLGGHSDVLAGLVATRNYELYKRLHFIQYSTGGTLSAFDSYLLTRGIKTLALRMNKACDNASIIANYLVEKCLRGNNCTKNDNSAGNDNSVRNVSCDDNAGNDSNAIHSYGNAINSCNGSFPIARVFYPGLSSHPGNNIQQKQAKSGGALVSFELAEGYDVQKFAGKLRLITVAESLGAVESLLCHPASMTHASIPAELREEMGISNRLLRLSVGIEHIDDLLADIQQGLDAL
ncbi:MAG: PLP-dependent aspartate aminotransferase family protein [Coriobacteriales bacterium]|jgi:cystathionine beta-lyase|nr:PLP-dependent aspartate aminotransferase family protein [Coriobacteriales bacterium]